jgi:hypothetical protein
MSGLPSADSISGARLGLRMPGELDLYALRQKPLPAPLSTPGESSATPFAAHPGAKPVLLFAGPLRGLISALHK